MFLAGCHKNERYYCYLIHESYEYDFFGNEIIKRDTIDSYTGLLGWRISDAESDCEERSTELSSDEFDLDYYYCTCDYEPR